MHLVNRSAAVFSLLAVFTCAPAKTTDTGPVFPADCPAYTPWDYGFNYDVRPEFTTRDGIQVDPSGQKISPELVDRLTEEVEQCLEETFGNPPKIPAHLLEPSVCQTERNGDTFPLPIRRDCIAVKVPDNWSWSKKDSHQQVLADKTSAQGCIDKGLCQTAEDCDCRWRAGIQGRVIVTTPSFYIYKDALIRLITGCGNPWGTPEFARCATPTTAPDSMGDKN
ncbi:hypothetical protein HY633_03430 [Candidatus Uhrbacteria bacterium]|nr:hypothetical protein [Candidatus Uhrbacteria bacterium]